MVDRRIVSSEDVARIGLRIKAARTLTALNQEEFAERHEFTYASVKNWELGKSIPRSDAVLKIVSALQHSGVSVTRDWLLYGSGSGPTHHRSDEISSESPTSLEERLGREMQIFELWCYNSKKNPIVATVADDLMEPLFKKGDVIGAESLTSLSDYEKRYPEQCMTKEAFLTEIEPGYFQPRFLRKNPEGIIKYLSTNNGNHIHEITYTGLAKILWIQKA